VYKSGETYIPDTEQVIDNAFCIAPLDTENFVVSFGEPDQAGTVLGPVFHAVGEAVAQQAHMAFFIGVENHILNTCIIKPPFYQIGGYSEYLRVSGVPEGAGIGYDAGVNTFSDYGTYPDTVAHGIYETVNQLTGTARFGLRKHKIGNGVRVEVVVNHNALARQIAYKVAHLVNTTQRVKIQKKEKIFLGEDTFTLIGVNIPNHYISSTGQYFELLRIL
jgi:hypothetical protein